MTSPAHRTVLVVGARGFLGGFIVAALRERGHRVLYGARLQGRGAREDERDCDLVRMCTPAAWRDVLQGVDAVVNVAGILRESGDQRFETIHVRAPLALAQACVDVGVRRYIQISALGNPEDGDFVASKHRFDETLAQLPLDAVILRPSVVYAVAGSYGGTSLLRALAAFPGVQLLPGDGRWLVQPVAAEDLGALVARALDAPGGIYEVGGPEPMTLRDYQRSWRRWLRIAGDRELRIPEALVTLQATLFERIGRGPVGQTMWRMLRRGNVTAPDANSRLREVAGFAPRALGEVLALRPSQVQDRWQAQLYFLAPVLRLALVVLWLISAWTGLLVPANQIDGFVANTALIDLAPVPLARGGGALDLVLAVWLLSGWRPRLAICAMTISVVAYTLVFGMAVPMAWLDPFGGLAKNLVILPALAVAWVLADRR